MRLLDVVMIAVAIMLVVGFGATCWIIISFCSTMHATILITYLTLLAIRFTLEKQKEFKPK